jgi:S1-C subfamily serine protease
LAAAILGAVFPLAASAATPGAILTDDSSGMVKVFSACPSGDYQGSGFLIGPRVLVTALHMLIDEQGNNASCSVTVTQDGTGQTARVTSFSKWYETNPSTERFTDFATAALDSPLVGHYFRIATNPPVVGQTVIGLGYPLGEPLNLAQGEVSATNTVSGIPLLALSILQTHGNSGGPLLDQSGDVIGLTQAGIQTGSGLVTSSAFRSLDLVRFLGGRPSQLSRGAIAGYPSTVCAAQPAASGGSLSLAVAARAAVYTYWSLLQSGRYAQGFQQLSAANRARLGGLSWFLGYFRGDPLRSVNVDLAPAQGSGGYATVNVVRLQTEGAKTGCRNWQGTYRLVYQNARWLIDYASLTFVAC